MVNEARPVGPMVEFDRAKTPDGRKLQGRFVTLEKIDPTRHGSALWAQMRGHDAIWDYLYEAPPADEAAFIATLVVSAERPDWMGYAVCTPDGAPVGYAFYLNITPSMGTIEVGNINFSPRLQRTPAASEAMYLMMREVFAMGYRRYEWKCNALNMPSCRHAVMPSRRAAQRLGFSWEGVFRQHLIVKGRNRDKAWLAMTDIEWPHIDAAFKAWMSPDNFDTTGTQIRALGDLTGLHRVVGDPAQMS